MAIIFDNEALNNTISKLSEREKELKCLYKVQGILNDNLPVDKFFMEIVKHIWGGWQYPNITRVKITFEGKVYKESGWEETEWVQSSPIVIDNKVSGKIEVFYTKFIKIISDSQFLPEEQKLLDTIAHKVSSYIFSLRLKKTIEAIDQDRSNTDEIAESVNALLPVNSDVYWIWRDEMACKIAEKLDMGKFGVKAIYLIGSVKNATAGPASDIDLMLHFGGSEQQKAELKCWLEGWSLCLAEMNMARTGYKTEGLLDLHFITDFDIEKQSSYAVMITSVDNRAKLLKKTTKG
ncbi:MAG: nucleotidyltransferase domain-containing protein [Bacteroidales bacterium]|nr:nucleotidyltransferase domain-containing protein [Bacteroidales bacterium]